MNRLPKEDEIRWIEYRLAEATYDESYKARPDALDAGDIGAWLAHVRDGKSWKEIGDSLYPVRGSKPEARRSEARRAYDRIELFLNDRTAFEALPQRRLARLKYRIEEVFGVRAEDFRAFILKGQLPQRAPLPARPWFEQMPLTGVPSFPVTSASGPKKAGRKSASSRRTSVRARRRKSRP